MDSAPDVPLTSPKEPTETSIALLVVEVHQLVSSGSAPSVRPPSAQLSSTISVARAGNAVASAMVAMTIQSTAILPPKYFLRFIRRPSQMMFLLKANHADSISLTCRLC